MSRLATTYHIKAPYAESYKLITHIRSIHNKGVLKKIGHEGSEDGFTYCNIYLKPHSKYIEWAHENLKSLGLVAI